MLDGACPCEAEFDDQAVLEEGPLALDATLGLRRMGADELNPEFVGGTAELRDGGQTAQLLVKRRLAVDEECAVLVGVEAEGKAMREADLGEQVEIGPGVLDLDESGPAEVGRVVDGADEGEPGATAFEPVVGRGIELQHEAEGRFALATAAVLLGPPVSLGGYAVLAKQVAQRLAADAQLPVSE